MRMASDVSLFHSCLTVPSMHLPLFCVLGLFVFAVCLVLCGCPPCFLFCKCIWGVLSILPNDLCLSHRDRTPLIRCASPMSPTSRLSHPFHFPVPRNSDFVAAANLFQLVCLYHCKIWPVLAIACHRCVAD